VRSWAQLASEEHGQVLGEAISLLEKGSSRAPGGRELDRHNVTRAE